MKRLLLTVGMLLMGIGLVGGAVAAQAGASLAGLDQQVGTNGSAAAAVLGLGLILAAFNPPGSVGWVRAGILYGFVVVVFEVVSYFHGKGFHLGPVIFGLAFTLLLIATYPERKTLIPSGATGTRQTATMSPAPAMIKAPDAHDEEEPEEPEEKEATTKVRKD